MTYLVDVPLHNVEYLFLWNSSQQQGSSVYLIIIIWCDHNNDGVENGKVGWPCVWVDNIIWHAHTKKIIYYIYI